MNRLGIYITAIAAIVLSSCAREDLLPQQDDCNQPCELVPLSISTGEMTKTSLSGMVVNWSKSDQIAVFDDLHYKNEFDAVEVNGPNAVFEGKVAAKTTDFYAVYPYSSAVKADAGKIYVTLPSEQTSKVGSFAEGHNISVAHGQKTVDADVAEGLVFKNVCALVKFTIPDKLSKIAEVSFTASNRSLVGDMAISKSDYGVTISSGSNTVRMKGLFSAGSTFYFVVAPGDINGFNITVTAENGSTYTKTSDKSFTAQAGKIKDLGIIEFPIEPKVVASHIYTSGVLTGTSVQLNLGLPPGMEDYVDKVEAYLRGRYNGNFYRTIVMNASSGIRPSVTMNVLSGSSYLQQGDYDATVIIYMNDRTIEKTIPVTIPVPEFVVTVSAYTSYSKYREGRISEANSCNAETIYGLQCSVNISDEILTIFNLRECSVSLKKSGVSNMLLSGGTFNKSNFYSSSAINNQDWGEYLLSAQVKFDGVTRSSSPMTLHITGLPYSVSPPSNSGSHPWSGSANSWGSSYVRLHGHTISQTFHVPGNIGVTASQNARIYRANTATDYVYRVSGTEVYRYTGSNSSRNTATNVNQSYSATLTSANPKVEISNSYGTGDFLGESTNARVYSVSVKYR